MQIEYVSSFLRSVEIISFLGLCSEKSKRGDTGKYELTLRNAKGEVKIPIDVVVLGKKLANCPSSSKSDSCACSDRPGKPEGPMKVSDVTKETCVVSWKPPLDNGGAPIERYVVEKQDLGRGGWTPAGDVNGETTSLRVTKLTPGKEYLFRVRAVNKEGDGEPLETTGATLAKNPYDEPSAPGKPEVADWDKDRVDLQWEAPVLSNRRNIGRHIIINDLCVYFRKRMVVHLSRSMLLSVVRKDANRGKRRQKFLVVRRKAPVVVYQKEKNMNFVSLLSIKQARQNLVNHLRQSLPNHVSVCTFTLIENTN